MPCRGICLGARALLPLWLALLPLSCLSDATVWAARVNKTATAEALRLEGCPLPMYSAQQQTARATACEVQAALNASARPGEGALCIFGSGFDTPMWAAMAARARVKFHVFEYQAQWAHVAKKGLDAKGLKATVEVVRYTCKARDWASQLRPMPRPTSARDAACDVTIVDSPGGGVGRKQEGRGQSMREALRITRAGGVVYLDDATRALAQRLVAHFWDRPCARGVDLIDVRLGFARCRVIDSWRPEQAAAVASMWQAAVGYATSMYYSL